VRRLFLACLLALLPLAAARAQVSITWTDAVLTAPPATLPPSSANVLALIQSGKTTQLPFGDLLPAQEAVSVLATAGLGLACTATVTIWQPTIPGVSSCALPLAPSDGERHTVDDLLHSGAYALTVTAAVDIGIGGASFVLTNPGESVTFRYSATLNQWVVE
jgi:hypothetical protein